MHWMSNMGFIDRQDRCSEAHHKKHKDTTFQHGEGVFHRCQSSIEDQFSHLRIMTENLGMWVNISGIGKCVKEMGIGRASVYRTLQG